LLDPCVPAKPEPFNVCSWLGVEPGLVLSLLAFAPIPVLR
jgi:hypothetical protein